VVILTSFAERERIHAALDAGAIGYLLKDAEPEEVLRGIRAAAAGESPFSAKAATMLLTRRVPNKNQGVLTNREREVLAGVVRGLANKQIARELNISEKTVKTHLSSIYAALGVTDRTQAALWAQKNGEFGDTAQ
jgi:DNA-binding NarL/FixJ family response regulator